MTIIYDVVFLFSRVWWINSFILWQAMMVTKTLQNKLKINSPVIIKHIYWLVPNTQKQRLMTDSILQVIWEFSGILGFIVLKLFTPFLFLQLGSRKKHSSYCGLNLICTFVQNDNDESTLPSDFLSTFQFSTNKPGSLIVDSGSVVPLDVSSV